MEEISNNTHFRRKLASEQKQFTEEHNKRLDKLRAIAKKNEIAVKDAEQVKTENIRHKGRQAINYEKVRASEVITNAKKSLTDVQKKLETQKQEIIKNATQQKDELENTYANRLVSTNDYQQTTLKDIDNNYNGKIINQIQDNKDDLSKIRDKGSLQIKNLSLNKTREYQVQQRQYQKKISNDKNKFEGLIYQNRIKQTHDIETQQNEHIKKVVNIDSLHKNELQKNKIKHKNEITREQNRFLKKYNIIQAQNIKIIDDLIARSDQSLKDQLTSYTQTKDKVDTKAQDPFYRPTSLPVNLSENEKEYRVSVQLPEHEQVKAQLSGNKRHLKLTLSRDYQEKSDAANGILNKVSRYETFSKEFDVGQIIEPKKISKISEGNKVTFIIPKA